MIVSGVVVVEVVVKMVVMVEEALDMTSGAKTATLTNLTPFSSYFSHRILSGDGERKSNSNSSM